MSCSRRSGRRARACDRCLARSWLLGALAGHLDRVRAAAEELLCLGDRELIAAVGGRRRGELERRLGRLEPQSARDAAGEAGIELLCRCDPDYPPRLRELPSAPSVLHVGGGIDRLLAAVAGEPVAIVGSRRATTYGTDTARSLARRLAGAGLSVISGMAPGIDSAAHAGALSVRGQTVAVLPGPADRPYPRSNRALHRRVIGAGVVVSELPPGTSVRSWMFAARNRIIAALAALIVVVEAGERSGALSTAAVARRLGRRVGAVPGRVTTIQAAGTNQLLAEGAHLVRDAEDVLDALSILGTRSLPPDDRPELTADERELLRAIGEGSDSAAALAREGVARGRELALLASLELAGYVRREPGGRFVPVR